MAFRNYLEEEDDKPYFTTNSLGYYYDKMEGFAEKVEQAAKILNVTKEEVEKRITFYIEQNKSVLDLRLKQWDEKLGKFDSSVETLLSEWVDDGTLAHVIDSTLIEQRLAPVTAQLEDIEKLATIVKGDILLQTLIDNAPDGTTVFLPRGTYNISQINITGKKNLKIYGNGAILNGTNANADAILNVTNSTNLLFEELNFTYGGKPTSFVDGKAACIKLVDYAFIKINKCNFNDFANVAIWADEAKDDEGVTGGTTSTPLEVTECLFKDQFISTGAGDTATSIFLGANGEYSTIVKNEFRKCYAAIKGYGANALVEGNTIMSCKAVFSANNALIYFNSANGSGGINSAKAIINNNRINHNNKGATAIYCIGDRNRNERRYTITHNHILVHGLSTVDSYGIGLKNADGSLIDGNYIKVAGKANILINDTTDVILTNNSVMDITGIRMTTNSTCHESNNVHLLPKSGQQLFLLETGSLLIVKEALKKSFLFRYNTNGSKGSETNIPNSVFTKVSTGKVTITHDLGHFLYTVSAIIDNSEVPIIPTVTRTINDFTVTTFDMSGNPVDANVMGVLYLSSEA